MHPTIKSMLNVVAKGDEEAIKDLLAEDVKFQPPTYYKTWTGRDPVAAVLGHVGKVFSEFNYRRIMGEGVNWACEFECKIDNRKQSTYNTIQRYKRFEGYAEQ